MPGVESHRLAATDNVDYVKYLRSIEDRWPEYKGFRAFLEDNSRSKSCFGFSGDVHVHDILSDNRYRPPLTFQAGNNSDIGSLWNTLVTFQTGFRARIILVDLDDKKTVDQRVLEMLRLSFNVEPLFFWSSLKSAPFPRRRREFLRMGRMTLKMLKQFATASGDISVAIIAIDKRGLPSVDHSAVYSLDHFLFILNEQPSMNDHEHPWTTPKIDPSNCGHVDLPPIVGSLLRAKQTTSSEEVLFHCLIIMARIHLATFCQDLRVYAFYDTDVVESNDWLDFRKKLDAFQNDVGVFSRYAKREFAQSVFRELLEIIQEDQEDLALRSRILETRLRDHLQASMGVESLKESRASIEEGKGVKLITILAFIFVPTSLASSIFGMNVQEINHTSKSIWAFTVLALSMTGVAIAAWVFSLILRAKWQRRAPRRRHHSWKERRRYAAWLLVHPREWRGAPRGTLLGLLTDGRFGDGSGAELVEL